MTLDPASLVASLFVGLLGMSVFGYGTKQKRLPQLVVGAALMGFPMVVSSAVWMALIAVALLGALWLAVRAGM